MTNPLARISNEHQHAIQEITRAYEQASQSLATAAQVEQYWLERINRPEPERLSFLERVDRFLLGEPGTGSLYDEIEGIVTHFRKGA